MKLRLALAGAILASVGTGMVAPAFAGAPAISPPPPHMDDICVYLPPVTTDYYCVWYPDLQLKSQ